MCSTQLVFGAGVQQAIIFPGQKFQLRTAFWEISVFKSGQSSGKTDTKNLYGDLRETDNKTPKIFESKAKMLWKNLNARFRYQFGNGKLKLGAFTGQTPSLPQPPHTPDVVKVGLEVDGGAVAAVLL